MIGGATKPTKSAKTPFSRRPQPDIKALVDRVMDPYGEHAELEAMKKERYPDEK